VVKKTTINYQLSNIPNYFYQTTSQIQIQNPTTLHTTGTFTKKLCEPLRLTPRNSAVKTQKQESLTEVSQFNYIIDYQ